MIIETQTSTDYSSRMYITPDEMEYLGNSVSDFGKVIMFKDNCRKMIVTLHISKEELNMLNKAYNDE